VIDRREVLAFANELSLRPSIVEKDYVLGWLLAGISHHEAISKHWVFKGGTCLKKCYFETYRFSEDLDFTLLDSSHINQDFLLAVFNEISAWIYEKSGIELPSENLLFEVYENPRGKLSAQGKVSYRGPIAPQGDLPRIKLDLASDEKLVLPAIRRPIYHPYSDALEENFQILCYSFEELFAEKLRALLERERPRDLYDVVHLFQYDQLRPEAQVVLSTFGEKSKFKGMPASELEKLKTGLRRMELEAEWSHMLAHQLPFLPPFEQFWNILPKVFDWLQNAAPASQLMRYPIAADEDETWTPPAMVHAWRIGVPLEAIRFAAANRLCVALGYQNTIRVIEPYSLRRTKAGHLFLHAIRVDSREHRAYRVDKIQSARITDRTFVPVYAIELTAAGPVYAPRTKSVVSASTRRHKPISSNVLYIVECPMCDKQFSRKKRDTTLRPHKNKAGRPCHGRRGILKETRYN